MTERELDATWAEIIRRQRDYKAKDVRAERDKLVALWKQAHPECVSEEPSRRHHTLDRIEEGEVDNKDRPERWVNDIYIVSVRRWTQDKVFDTRGGMIQIGINSHDGTARHDWRDFQAIKNQIAGPECEAFELYPAESRLLDPSNYYTLWCFPGVKRLKIGIDEGRRVLDQDEAWAPQRAFEK